MVYCCKKTFSFSISLYRDVKHYGQHMRFKSDENSLICSKSEILGDVAALVTYNVIDSPP